MIFQHSAERLFFVAPSVCVAADICAHAEIRSDMAFPVGGGGAVVEGIGQPEEWTRWLR